MWRRVGTAMVLVVLAVGAACGHRDDGGTAGDDEGGPGVVRGVVQVGARERGYRVYVPEEPGGALLVGLHGGMGSGDQFAGVDGIEARAEREGFVVVHPDGVGRTWNGGVCCGRAARVDVDDVAFVAALIDRLVDDHGIDPDRVYAYGHSNGGIMAYRLACELGDRIAGIAVVAGTLGVDGCRPDRPVSVLHLHGDADRNLPIDGGVGDRSVAGVDFPSPRDGFATFAAANGCPEAAVEVDGNVTTEHRGPCDGGTEAVFVTVAGGDHPWPADATGEVVDFLLAHPR